MPRIKSLIKFSIRLFFIGMGLAVIGFATLWLIIVPSLPSVEALRDVELQVPLRVESADGKLITTIGEQRRIPLALEQIPPRLRQAFLAAEDGDFYSHPGVDWVGTMRGLFGYVRYLGKRRVPGGSTITQQVARRFFLSNEFSVTRKVREIFLAFKIERELSKDEILELYLNKEFLGHRAYGVGAAARIYYGKSVDELSLAEMAMIAGLPQRPSVVNPVTRPDLALARRAYVLRRMRDEKFIDQQEYSRAMQAADQARVYGPEIELSAPWIAEAARQIVVERFGAETAYTAGLRVVTTAESSLQLAAQSAVTDGLVGYDRRHGWRGSERTLDSAILDDRAALASLLADTPAVAGLLPAIVLTSTAESASLLLAGGEEVELTLDQVSWARKHLARDALGARPQAVDEVLVAGDLVRVRRTENGIALAQIPEAQAALVSLRPETGAVAAMIGGLDFDFNQFNRATQSKRQPGSAFKPFIYAAAIDQGYTPASLVNDAPIVFDDPSQERTWKPQNFSEQFFGPTRLREAMIHSRNLISVRLVLDLGVDPTADYVSRLGFDRADIPNGPSMALGSASITPLDLATAYAVFANGGYRIEPMFIYAIHDDQGRELPMPRSPWVCRECPPRAEPAPQSGPAPNVETRDRPRAISLAPTTEDSGPSEASPAVGDASKPDPPAPELHGPPLPVTAERVISPQTAWLIRSMMRDVVRFGTGRRALALGRSDLAGKTGTTNDQRDTWFSGFGGGLVTTVWVGMDSNESLGRLEQGGRTALPIWVDFMRTAIADAPEQTDPVPDGIVEASIDPETGLRVRAGAQNAIREWFPAENLPPLQEIQADDPDEADPYDIF